MNNQSLYIESKCRYYICIFKAIKEGGKVCLFVIYLGDDFSRADILTTCTPACKADIAIDCRVNLLNNHNSYTNSSCRYIIFQLAQTKVV